jgi:membrane protein
MSSHSALPQIKRLLVELADSKLENGAAALAFYAMLAVFPAAIFGLSVLPYLPIPDLQRAIFDLLSELLPSNAATLFHDTVQRVLSQKHTGLLSFGLLFAIWSATSGIVAMMEELDVVHRVRRPRSALRARGKAFVLLLCLFVLIVGTFALVIFGGTLQSRLAERIGSSDPFLIGFAAARWLIITFALLLGTAVMYRVGPTQSHSFKLWSPGSVFATSGQMLASFGMRFYVEHFADYDAIYGSLGGVIVLLLWMFLVGWVFLLGAAIDMFFREQSVTASTMCEQSAHR